MASKVFKIYVTAEDAKAILNGGPEGLCEAVQENVDLREAVEALLEDAEEESDGGSGGSSSESPPPETEESFEGGSVDPSDAPSGDAKSGAEDGIEESGDASS